MAETTKNKVTFGLKGLVVWFESEEYKTPHAIPGIISYSRTMSTSNADMYADDTLYFRLVDERNGEGTLSMADIPDEIKAKMLGWRIDGKGGLVHMKDAKPDRFHMAFSVNGDDHERRKFVYGCEASVSSDNNETRGESVSFRTDEATVTEFGYDADDGEHVWDYTIHKNADAQNFEKSFSEVVFPQPATVA